MTRRDYISLYLISLLILAAAASFEHSPGYMDADYYLLTGQLLAEGHGFTEPVLWNYLDDPQGLPHPSHAYWMPLPSFISAIGLLLFPNLSAFYSGRIFFILLAALIPVLTAKLAFALSENIRIALLSGGFAILSAFYLPYLLTTDTFALSMVLGALFFLIIVGMKKNKFSVWQWALLGILAALLHLTRAEGPIWLAIGLLSVWISDVGWRGLISAMGGYLLVMVPWFIRNWLAFGGLFAPGPSRTLWLTSYDQLFAYPASQLTLQSWLTSGWQAILGGRLEAVFLNLQSALAVEGAVLLAALIIWGGWRLRSETVVRVAAAAWLALFIVMSFIFPFSGARGGFFHAAAALQPLAWALAAIGLGFFVEWGAARRGWQKEQAWRVFSGAALVSLFALTVVVFNSRVIGTTASSSVWDASAHAYVELGEELDDIGISDDTIVMVNNPPGFSLISGYPAIVIPDGGIEVTLAAAHRYRAEVLLLEANHPAELNRLYAQPKDLPGLSYIATLDGTHIFFFTD